MIGRQIVLVDVLQIDRRNFVLVMLNESPREPVPIKPVRTGKIDVEEQDSDKAENHVHDE